MVIEKNADSLVQRRRRRLGRLSVTTIALSLVAGSFMLGLVVGALQLPPYSAAKLVWDILIPAPESSFEDGSGWEAEGLESAFSRPVIGGNLYYPPIIEIQGIGEANTRAFVDVKDFKTAYESIEVFEVEQLSLDSSSLPVTRVSFSYAGGGKRYAFSYGFLPDDCGAGLATLVIPGSGDNQSSEIFSSNPENYH